MRYSVCGLAFLASLFLASGLHAEILSEDLAGSWKIRLVDDPAAADPATDDSGWSSIEIPGDLSGRVNSSSSFIWLRRTVITDPLAGNYALYLGATAGKIEAFANGLPLPRVQTFADGPTILALPPVDHPGPTLLALRIEMRRGMPAGLIRPPVRLVDLREAYRLLFFTDISSTVLALFYAALALYFVGVRRRTHAGGIEYFYGLTAVVGILAAPTLRQAVPFSWVLSTAATAFAALIPALLLRYLWKFTEQPLEIVSRLALPVAGLVGAGFALLQSFHLERPAMWTIHLWYLALIPLWGFLVFQTFRKTAREMNPSGFALLGMFAYFFYAGSNLLLGGEYFTTNLSAITLSFAPAMLVPGTLQILTLWLQDRRTGRSDRSPGQAERLARSLFHYIPEGLERTLRSTVESLRSPSGPGSPGPAPASSIAEMDQMMKDILELARLETSDAPASASPINIRESIEAIMADRPVSKVLHLNGDLFLEAPVDLFNSALLRLIEFRGFAGFDHIDLIGTVDSEGRLHLRFLMHQPDRAGLRQIHAIVGEKLMDPDGLWIRWKIVLESIRLLHGSLHVKALSGKYLAIDLTLPAKLRSGSRSTPAGIPLVFLHEGEPAPIPASGETWKKRIRRIFQKEIA